MPSSSHATFFFVLSALTFTRTSRKMIYTAIAKYDREISLIMYHSMLLNIESFVGRLAPELKYRITKLLIIILSIN